MKKFAVILVGLIFCVLILFLLENQRIAMAIPQILLGWMDFIQRNFHQMRFRWEVLWSVLLYMMILLVGGHFFAGWFCRQLGGRVWKWSWSVRCFVAFLLMFIVGTSAVGVGGAS